ncbi:MAG: biopolymer transporter ExbD [Pseudomonadota bacterium]
MRKNANRRRLRYKRAGKIPVSGTRSVRSEINVTPFVDVVLVLLIIFMVVTPMLQRGIDVLLPPSAHHKEVRDTGEQVFVSVRQDKAIFLGEERVALSALEQRLRRLLMQQPAPPVFIKGDQRLNFAPVREVMEAAHRAGATAVSLATRGDKGE